MIRLINFSFGQTIIPVSKYYIIKEITKDSFVTYHLKCEDCQKYGLKYMMGENVEILQCSNCQKDQIPKNKNVLFVTFPIENILKTLISNHKNEMVYPPKNFNRFPMTDIFNSQNYIDICETSTQKISPYIRFTLAIVYLSSQLTERNTIKTRKCWHMCIIQWARN
jgi:hypothetical protein